MARRHGRGRRGLLEWALHNDWPAAAVVAGALGVIGVLLPHVLEGTPFLTRLAATLRPIVWTLCGFFALVGVVKLRLRAREVAARRLQRNSSGDALHGDTRDED